MSFSVLYRISKYLGMLKLFLGFPGAFVLVGKNRFYFGNFNGVGILEKGFRELPRRSDLYKLCDCFIDVGAHIGAKSFWFNKINPEARAVVFEPNPLAYKFLEKNLSHLQDLKKFNIALGENEGEREIFVDFSHLDTASLNRESFYLNKNAKTKLSSHPVPVRKLDDFVGLVEDKENVFLKIDVETYERSVLVGAQEMLGRVRFLEIEVYQDERNLSSEVLGLLPRGFNILSCDLKPNLLNLVLEFK